MLVGLGKKMESTMDFVAAVAARGIGAGEGLVEPQPPELPAGWFFWLEEGGGRVFTVREGWDAERLREELVRERERVAPFLRVMQPELSRSRRVVGVERAQWRLEPGEEWEEVRLPHYGGPMGRARAWYRSEVELGEGEVEGKSVWVCFGGVDYRAAVFWNGQLVGTHEGFFSPFELEVTEWVRAGRNELLVRVENDAICMGNGMWKDSRSGDKLYAATGLGWDDPELGWHHCPPGMGIWRPVRVEVRSRVFLRDVFVRPMEGLERGEVWVEVWNCGEWEEKVELELVVYGANFGPEEVVRKRVEGLPAAGPGMNRYRVGLELRGARVWGLREPWMYALQVRVESGAGEDWGETEFGMRRFVLDEGVGRGGRRGRFLLNGKEIVLRGANTMGHEQVCVFQKNLEQLRDDILLARLANLNFLRFTQRPVEREVYWMCDRLGMLAQTDLPLFGYVRRNQFAEVVRQAGEMERMIRRHPSCVLVSFINEPFPRAWGDRTHRHLERGELEGLFAAAALAVRVENPDRQIKPIDGDYEPPGPGLPDNHCYSAWYNGHGLDLGKLHKGFWVPVKPGWNYACGEYGAEGLEEEDLMRRRYPAQWLPAKGDVVAEEQWTPARIPFCQTGSHFYLWFEAGRSVREWVERSQAHQAWATRLMTEAFRRDERMVSSAVHLLIDAWPAGWMKALMDCERRPKAGYFALREALAPVGVFLRADRTAGWEGEELGVEVWVCADVEEVPLGLEVGVQLVGKGGEVVASRRVPARAEGLRAMYQGTVRVRLPEVRAGVGEGVARERWRLQAGLLDGTRTVHDSELELVVFRRPKTWREEWAEAKAGMEAVRGLLPKGWLIVEQAGDVDSAVREAELGARVLLLGLPEGEYVIAGTRVLVERCGMQPRHFVARARGHAVAEAFAENDFRFWHDAALGRPSPLLHRLFYAEEPPWRGILRTGQVDWGVEAKPALAAAELEVGRGRVVFCELELKGRLSNPVAALFLEQLGKWI